MPVNPFIHSESTPEESRRIAKGLIRLRQSLDQSVPERNISNSLLLATFNIRELDSTKYGLRTEESIFYLAEIINRFDLVAVQEIRRSLTGLNRLMEKLGGWWKFIVTDTTEGSKGNEERMGFLYDSRKVKFASLSGEVVIPPKDKMNPAQQLARTPFLVGFESGWYRFMLCTVHIYYGDDVPVEPDRLKEIQAVAEFMRRRADDPDAFSENIILLGDFNIFDPGDVTLKAITSQGFKVPKGLQKLPSNVAQNKYYDQIAFHSAAVDAQLETSKAGVYNFFKQIYRDEDEAMYASVMGEDYALDSKGKPRTEAGKTRYYKEWRTFQLSDHLPMWIELQIDFSQAILEEMAK